jgi:hypothetical protein
LWWVSWSVSVFLLFPLDFCHRRGSHVALWEWMRDRRGRFVGRCDGRTYPLKMKALSSIANRIGK